MILNDAGYLSGLSSGLTNPKYRFGRSCGSVMSLRHGCVFEGAARLTGSRSTQATGITAPSRVWPRRTRRLPPSSCVRSPNFDVNHVIAGAFTLRATRAQMAVRGVSPPGTVDPGDTSIYIRRLDSRTSVVWCKAVAQKSDRRQRRTTVHGRFRADVERTNPTLTGRSGWRDINARFRGTTAIAFTAISKTLRPLSCCSFTPADGTR
jgi:hypothetical protein